MRIGFVGLGVMGGSMASRLLRAGHQLWVHDIDQAKAKAQLAEGALWAGSIEACLEPAEIFITSLPGPAQCESLLNGPKGLFAAAKPGRIWIDMTTNRRELVIDAAQKLARQGMSVLDAPVTGAVDGARTGRLTIFVGGEAAVIDKVEPVLKLLGRVVRCGPLGSGNVVKLVTNQLWFIHAAAIGEGLALGKKAGVDLGVLYEAIKDSVGDSFVARHDAPSIFAGHYDPSFSLDLCVKDLTLIAELAATAGVPIRLSQCAKSLFEEARLRYGGQAAELHVAKLVEEGAGIDLRLDGDWPDHSKA
jgi:3-hydroxyisobutyrate dehydrogenase